MKKILPLILVLIGAALLITAVVFWIDSSTSTQPDSFGKSLRDWITLILGIGASIKGWMDIFKKEKPTPPTTQFAVEGGNPQISTGDHARNIQTETYIENQTVQQPSEPKTPKSLNQLPAPPLDFIGREKELTQLRQNIEKGALISGVQGMGGIGKTTLGLKLAEEIAPKYPDGQIYLDLRGSNEQTPLTPEQAMAHVINSFYPEAKLPESFNELASMYRSVLSGKSILLFYDNARDEQQLNSLLPPKGCVFFVTSRQYISLPGLAVINLETLVPKDAKKLIQDIVPKVGKKDAEILAEKCGYLPLAIRAAVSILLLRPDWDSTKLIKHLNDNRARLNLVESSLSLSYHSLDSELQHYLRCLGIFSYHFAKKEISAVWEPDLLSSSRELDDILGKLLISSLLRYDPTLDEYYFHDLTHLFIESLLFQDNRWLEILARFHDYKFLLLKECFDEFIVFRDMLFGAYQDLIKPSVELNDKINTMLRAGNSIIQIARNIFDVNQRLNSQVQNKIPLEWVASVAFIEKLYSQIDELLIDLYRYSILIREQGGVSLDFHMTQYEVSTILVLRHSIRVFVDEYVNQIKARNKQKVS